MVGCEVIGWGSEVVVDKVPGGLGGVFRLRGLARVPGRSD